MSLFVERSPVGLSARCLVFFLMICTGSELFGQEIPYGTGNWDTEIYGNHRAVVRVTQPDDAVWVHVPWRRRDLNPEAKNIILVDAKTGKRLRNVVRIDINREFGDLVFQPRTTPGGYYVYYLPFITSGRSNYPEVIYPKPKPTAQGEWLRRHRLNPDGLLHQSWRALPPARVVAFQSIDEFNSFYPMEVIATRAETEALLAKHPGEDTLLFSEDRSHPIRMTGDLPLRWIQAGSGKPLHGEALRGEFFAFQIGVFAPGKAISNLTVSFSDLNRADGRRSVPGSAFRCFNLGGIDWNGKPFRKRVSIASGKVQPLWCGVQIPENALPGEYQGTIIVSPVGMAKKTMYMRLMVSRDVIEASGDNDPWRQSRLRWLDSTIALDDEIVAPFTPLKTDGDSLEVLGRRVVLDTLGFPKSILSFFSPEMTHLVAQGRELLADPVSFIVEDATGETISWRGDGRVFVKKEPGAVAWESSLRWRDLRLNVQAQLEFDGNLEYSLKLSSERGVEVGDVRLEIPIARKVAKYMMGMGRKGGFRPRDFQWKWDVRNNQDSAWVGDINAGLQFSLKDDHYQRPLNTNFYHSKPLIIPGSWSNGGQGSCHLFEKDSATFLISCSSGSRRIVRGEPLHFDFRLLLTPFKPLDTRSHWTTRFYHRFEPVEVVAATGANTINVHHATRINPFINYPFLRPQEMKTYIEEAHRRHMKVKIYYTVRELSNRAAELFALRSLGDEILSYGPGGGFSWLQEHLGANYIAGWLVPRLKDAAVINSGVSRWHNYYLEGLNWLVKNVGIDGLYIDDVAFDRTVMKRVRKILDRGRPGALIDLHSANQFNRRDGFANSANLYLEHFPYLNRIWFGEYFDYDSPADFWLVELSGIPFGVMGEMLQDGGNPWRGMLYGMTNRLPWAGDPRPIWKIWDEFGIRDSRMIGYWVPDNPVKTTHPDVYATAYVKKDSVLISLASWAKEPVDVTLAIDWAALGLKPDEVRMTAHAIEDFQDAAEFSPPGRIVVQPGQGWLLILEPD